MTTEPQFKHWATWELRNAYARWKRLELTMRKSAGPTAAELLRRGEPLPVVTTTIFEREAP